MKTSIAFLFGIISLSVLADPGERPPKPVGSAPVLNIDFNTSIAGQVNSLQNTFFEKKIVHKPAYFVNTYVGNFQTSFTIDLPKNDFFSKGLVFNYNSGMNQNLGYGVGFSLNLPKIILKNKKYYFKSSSPNELVEVKNDISITGRIAKIESALNKKIIIKKYFRLKDEENFSLFVEHQEGILQLMLDGQSNYFDKEGNLVTKISPSGRVMTLSFEDQRLISISSPSEKWQMAISYRETETEYKYIDGQFVRVPKGINDIIVRQNLSSRSYSFTYQGNLLTNVKKEGALHVVFNAEYKTQQGKVTQEPFLDREIGKKAILFKNKDKTVQFEKIIENSGKSTFELDLNGDFITDEVTLRTSEDEGTVKKAYEQFRQEALKGSDCDEERCRMNAAKWETVKNRLSAFLNSQKMNVSVRLGIFSNGQYQLQSDPSLSMSFDISLIGSFRVYSNERSQLTSQFNQVRTFRFLDINNDGKKDLILFNNDEEKKFVEANQDQDITVLSAFNFVNRPQEDNIFKFKGSEPIAFLFKTDEVKLASLPVKEKEDIYFIPNVSFWERSYPGIKINSQSMVFDYNKDGYSDIMTGRTVYLLGDNNEIRTKELTDNELKALFNISNLTVADLKRTHYGLIDMDGDGVWETYIASNSYVHPIDRRLHILTGDLDIAAERPSDTPVIVSLKSTYGGLVKVDYQYTDGAYVVKKVSHILDDINQNNWEEEYSYEGSRWHTQKNIFLGFKKSSVVTKLFSNRDKKLIGSKKTRVSEYDLDDQNGPVFYLSRARYAGRVLNEKKFSGMNLEKEVKSNYINHVFPGYRSFSFLSKQVIHEIGKNDLTIQSGLPAYQYDIPTKERTRNESNGKSELSIIEKKIIDGMYLLKNTILTKANHLGEIRLLEKNFYNSSGFLIEKRAPVFTENFYYDDLGRMTYWHKSNGEKQTYEYIGSTNLAAAVTTNDLKINYAYTDIENNISQFQIDEASDKYNLNYTTDSILMQALKNGLVIFEQKMTGKKQFDAVVLDEKYQLKLDSFGRVASKTQFGDGDNLVLFERSYNEVDLPIQEYGPSFENTAFPFYAIETSYDSLGEVTYERKTDDQGEEIAEFSISKGLCSEKVTEIGFKEVLCKYGDGQVYSTYIPNEQAQFSYGFGKEIIGVQPFGITYIRNSNGDITKSLSSAWGNYSRFFDYSKNKIIYDSGVVEVFRPSGELQAFSNGLSESANFEMQLDYKKDLLRSINLTIGELKNNHYYQYNSSRVLVEKREFNTKWSYHLDSFDRVLTETIKDSRNSYSLNYARTNGLVTSVAPYISSISYSPLKKPSYIEFANGLTLELIYGPRGELLNYSMTKGAIVYYSANYNYRSDLKLVEQSVLTNSKLDVEISNYSYNNKFELAESPKLKNIQRDERGQVEKLGNASFSYHHGNLIKISTANQEITNFYANNNRFVGSLSNHDESFYRISADEVEVNGELQRLIVIEGIPVGLLHRGSFYPVIVDQKLSVVGLIEETGSGIKFLRTFDEWGNLTQVLGDQKIEQTVAFSYAGLLQNPLVDKIISKKVYFSETRVYSPELGQWLSTDSTVFWNPEVLVSIPGNWNPLLYANGDPVNFTDKSGRFVPVAIPAAAIAAVSAVEIVGNTTALSVLAAYGASKIAAFFGSRSQGEINDRFFGANGAWTRVGKKGLEYSMLGTSFELAGYVPKKDFTQLFKSNTGKLTLDYDYKDTTNGVFSLVVGKTFGKDMGDAVNLGLQVGDEIRSWGTK